MCLTPFLFARVLHRATRAADYHLQALGGPVEGHEAAREALTTILESLALYCAECRVPTDHGLFTLGESIVRALNGPD